MKKVSLFVDRSFTTDHHSHDPSQKVAMELISRLQKAVICNYLEMQIDENDQFRKFFCVGWSECNNIISAAKTAKRIEILVSRRNLPQDSKGGKPVIVKVSFFKRGDKESWFGLEFCLNSLGEFVCARGWGYS